MKTVAVPECFRKNRKMCGEFLARVKEQIHADHIIWISGGSFLENGFPAPNDIRADGELLKDMGADLVLSLPETAVLDREGTATFAEAALISKLRCIESIAVPVSGAVTEAELRKAAMFLFQEPREFQIDVKRELARGLGFEEAKRVCIGKYVPGADLLLEDPLNGKAVDFIKCLYQIYCCIKVELVPAEDLDCAGENGQSRESGHGTGFPENAAGAESAAETGCVEGSSLRNVGKAGNMKETASDDDIVYRLQKLREDLGIDLFRARVKETAGGSEEIRSLLEKEPSQITTEEFERIRENPELRKYVLRVLSGIRMADNQMCGLHTYCPYARVTAAAEPDGEWMQYVKERSWVPLLTEEEMRMRAEEDPGLMLFLKIDDKVRELRKAL